MRWLAVMLVVAGVTAPPIDDTSVAAMDRLLTARYGPDEPGAVAIVSRMGVVLLHKAYGLADLEHGVAMTPDAVFRLASVTKVFTAACVLKLVEADRLALEDAVSRFLPDAPPAWEPVTVGQLLSHTSGLPELLDRDDLRRWIRTARTTDELLLSVRERALDFEPGSQSAYSNTNYVVLGAILEQVGDGATWPEVLERELLEPLALSHTRLDDPREVLDQRVAGYTADGEGGWLNEIYYEPSVLGAAGALRSTAEDLRVFHEALCEGRVLSSELLGQALTPRKLPWFGKGRYGLGWEIAQVAGRRVGIQGGDISGFRHYVLVLPEERLFVAVLTNRPGDDDRVGALVLQLAELALSEPR